MGRPINLQIDATFFGRVYGFLIFHDGWNVIYFKEVKTESIKDFKEGLLAIKAANYSIQSVIVDGRRGYINNIRKLFGNIPIQMCLFHQKAIIRRYITDRPRNQCAIELKELMGIITKPEHQQQFINDFYCLKDKYCYFLQQRNEFGDYKYRSLRSALRSIETNLPYLFTYSDIPDLKIPSTINRLEGFFGHLKPDLKIHRGLKENRKKKAVKFFLKNFGKKCKNSTTLF